MVVGATHEAAWRNLASHLHGEGRQNAKDASFYWKPYTLQTGFQDKLPAVAEMPASTKLKSNKM